MPGEREFWWLSVLSESCASWEFCAVFFFCSHFFATSSLICKAITQKASQWRASGGPERLASPHAHTLLRYGVRVWKRALQALLALASAQKVADHKHPLKERRNQAHKQVLSWFRPLGARSLFLCVSISLHTSASLYLHGLLLFVWGGFPFSLCLSINLSLYVCSPFSLSLSLSLCAAVGGSSFLESDTLLLNLPLSYNRPTSSKQCTCLLSCHDH